MEHAAGSVEEELLGLVLLWDEALLLPSTGDFDPPQRFKLGRFRTMISVRLLGDLKEVSNVAFAGTATYHDRICAAFISIPETLRSDFLPKMSIR